MVMRLWECAAWTIEVWRARDGVGSSSKTRAASHSCISLM
jgi:hypothetical protein